MRRTDKPRSPGASPQTKCSLTHASPGSPLLVLSMSPIGQVTPTVWGTDIHRLWSAEHRGALLFCPAESDGTTLLSAEFDAKFVNFVWRMPAMDLGASTRPHHLLG